MCPTETIHKIFAVAPNNTVHEHHIIRGEMALQSSLGAHTCALR